MSVKSGTQTRPATMLSGQTGAKIPLGNFRTASYYLSKTDTLKRARPKDLFSNGTAFSVVFEKYSSSSDTVWTSSVGPGILNRYQAPVSYHYSQGVVSNSATSDTERLACIAIARNKILAQARDRGVNLANMLAEYRQTSSLFVDALQKVYVATLAVVKKDPRVLMYGHYYPNGKRVPGASLREEKRFFNEYLVYVYGVKPLQQDVHESIAELKNKAAIRPPEAYFDAYVSRRASARVSFTGSHSRKGVVDQKWHLGVKARARVVSTNNMLNATLGSHGFTNPASVAWELLPWSFVYDWWFNTGEFLESLDNCIYIDGTQSKLIYTVKRRFDSTASILGCEGTYFNDVRSRIAPESLGTVANFVYKKSVSAQHIANGLALFGQKLSGVAIRSRTARSNALLR